MANETLIVVTLGSDTGLAADQWVNNWVAKGVTGGSSAAAVVARLATFYDAIDDLFSTTVSGTGADATVDCYSIVGHLDGSPHGSPFDHRILGWGADVGGSALPSEVAMCLTLEGTGRSTALVESGSTRPKQRRTGRIYLGPLSTGVSEVSGGRCRIATTVQDRVLDAAEVLANGMQADGTPLCVWSRANAAVYELEAVSMDNAFDTMRSRGENPTNRDRRSV